jgi:hypothetical protein
MALVSPDFWYQIFWCQEFMFATQSAIFSLVTIFSPVTFSPRATVFL